MIVRVAVYLGVRTYKVKFEKALDLKRASLDCLTWLYRCNDPEFPWGLDLQSERKVIVAGAAEFLEWPFQDINEQELGEDMDLAKKVAERLSQIPAAQKLKAKSFLTDAYIVALLEEDDVEGRQDRIKKKEENLKKAKALDDSSALLDEKSLKSSIREVKKDARSYARQFRLQRTPKISIDPKDVALVFSLMSTLFLISGYIHTRLLLSRFGIDSSDFFNLTDYLAASLDEIRSALFGAVAAIGGLWIGFVHHERLTGDEKKIELAKSDAPFNFFLLISAIGFLFAAARYDVKAMWITGGTATFLFIMLKLPPLFVRHFERPSPKAMLFVSYWLGAFAFFVVQSPFVLAVDIRNVESMKALKYEFEMTDGASLGNELAIITASYGHFFVYDRELQNAVVVPKGGIAKVFPIVERATGESDVSGEPDVGEPDSAVSTEDKGRQ